MAKRRRKIEVQGTEITISVNDQQAFISMTDMTKGYSEGSGLIGK